MSVPSAWGDANAPELRAVPVERFLLKPILYPASNQFGALSRDQHSQDSSRATNVSGDRYECFRHGRVLLRQPLKTRADIMELIDFIEDCFENHGFTPLAEKPKMGGLQMAWLRSEDLKEEKVVTTPLPL